jgi:hypothetical protein
MPTADYIPLEHDMGPSIPLVEPGEVPGGVIPLSEGPPLAGSPAAKAAAAGTAVSAGRVAAARAKIGTAFGKLAGMFRPRPGEAYTGRALLGGQWSGAGTGMDKFLGSASQILGITMLNWYINNLTEQYQQHVEGRAQSEVGLAMAEMPLGSPPQARMGQAVGDQLQLENMMMMQSLMGGQYPEVQPMAVPGEERIGGSPGGRGGAMGGQLNPQDQQALMALMMQQGGLPGR